MQDPRQDMLDRVLGELFRAPEPLREIELERALTRLQAARSDASYLLLHRVLLLETALRQQRQHATTAADADEAVIPGPAPSAAAAPAAASRSLLRDAAVVTLGVVAGQAIWGAMSAEPDFDADLAGDLDGLLD